MEHYLIFFNLAVALLFGLLLSRVTKKFGLPAVTGYLVAGLIIGPYGLGRLGIAGLGFGSIGNVSAYSILSETALGFIAFTIGNEFRMTDLKKTGKKVVVVSIFEAVMAMIFVDAALITLHFILGEDKFPLTAAITLGAIAAATAPAATLMVVRQYKADGPVTQLLLPVVALDDAIGLISFALSFGIAKSMLGKVNLISIILEPLLEIVLSLGVGAALGFIFSFIERFFHSRSKRLAMSVAFIMFAVAISMLKFTVFGINISFSNLLTCMMLGTVFCNVCDFSEELMDRVDKWTAPLFILFFVLSGAELQLDVFLDVAVLGIGIVYIVFRCLGKYIGAYSGSAIMKCEPQVKKALGITLFPQAGVALGMSLSALSLFPENTGRLIRNVVLFGVLIFELFGPTFTKSALMSAGEIKPEGRKSSRRKNVKSKKQIVLKFNK